MILLRPWWLLALPVLALAAWALWRRGPDAGGWQGVLSPAMLAGLAALGQVRAAPGWLRLLPLGGALALVLGLSGPALPRGDAPVFAQNDAVVIALDMSGSVVRGGLADAQAGAAQIMAGLPGRPVGLILYAGEAYSAAAPTADPRVLESLLSVLDAETMPDRSSSPSAALALAGQMLTGLQRADLVVISDGGGVDAATVAEAQRLRDAGVRVQALSVTGDPPGDAAALSRIADRVAPATAPGPVVAALSRSAVDRDPAMVALQHRDLGPWIAAFALIPLLWQFRRQA
ncbi:VWA domain-containing protein [Paracoccus laeviglucosivorans]|uniref:Ca-activated chloride channel family protein n=1 Tax=Paracoccus laeviglucosivorans TaxID=1197861 RepID=A0A521B863_9RHOB|nr:VWA domain-containing protein [Paracoccus laeviglucosivorans]SMO43235.1 Ca-activated chloride channel family protein [Paracoccus laeviglucosivorans]